MYRKTAEFSLVGYVFLIIVQSILLAGCGFPGLLSSSSYDSAEVVAQKATISARMTETMAAENAPAPTIIPPTVTPTAEVQCAFVWTLKQDDDLSLLFSSYLDETIKKSTGLGVVWYGENCIDMETNSLVRFYAANLDITIMFEGNEEKTEQWLGDQIQSVMESMEMGLKERPDVDDYPIMLHFVYVLDGKYVYLEFELSRFRMINADASLSGEDLYSALFN